MIQHVAVFGARRSGGVLLQDLCGYAVADGFPAISEGESLPDLQRNVVFESESQFCVISWHHHLHTYQPEGGGGQMSKRKIKKVVWKEEGESYVDEREGGICTSFIHHVF